MPRHSDTQAWRVQRDGALAASTRSSDRTFSSLGRAVTVGMVAVALTACHRKGPCETLVVEVIGDDSHAAEVSPDKVKRGVGGVYLVRGSTHQHAFRLKDEDMHTLMSGGSVTTRTSSANAHLHDVLVRCQR